MTRFATLLIVLTSFASICYAGKWFASHLDGASTFKLGAIIPIFGKNYSINYSTGILALEGLKHGIYLLNEHMQKGVFGYKFELEDVYVPDPYDDNAALNMIYYVYGKSRLNSKVMFVIGPEATFDSLTIATLVKSLEKARGGVVSAYGYGPSSSVFDPLALDCENTLKSIVPSDTIRFKVIADLLRHFNWSYVAIMSSWGYEMGDATKFKKQIEELDMCVPIEDTINEETDVDNAIRKIEKNSLYPVKVIVLFTKNSDSRKILIALKNLQLVNRFILIFAYGSGNFHEVVHGYEDVALGSWTVDASSLESGLFKRMYLKLNPNNTRTEYFHLFWEDLFQCQLVDSEVLKNVHPPKRKQYKEKCKGNESMTEGKGYYPYSLAGRLTDTVMYTAMGLHKYLMNACRCRNKVCQNVSCAFDGDKTKYPNFYTEFRKGMCGLDVNNRRIQPMMPRGNTKVYHPLPAIFNIWNFQEHDGKRQNEHVATWKLNYGQNYPVLPAEALKNAESIELSFEPEKPPQFYLKNHSGVDPPTASCREECKAGSYQLYLTAHGFNQEKKLCCWKCIPCPKNNIVLYNHCLPCHYTETSNLTINRCVPLPERILDIDSHSGGLVIGLVALSLGGGIIVLFTVVVFILCNKNHVVRASGRDLSYSILCGLMLLFSCPILFLMKPTKPLCAFRDIVPYLAFLLCYAALGLKVIRIYRIFISAETRVSRPMLVTTSSQLSILGCISATQCLVASIWFINNSPETEKVVSENELFVTYHCKGVRNYAKYVANLFPSIMAQISCTLLAYKTRNFPKNYNEAKYIANTLFVTFLYWCIFLPTFSFQSSSDTYFAEHAISVQFVLIGYTTLIGLFAHKLWLILKRKPLEEHHDSLKARARSLSSRSSRKESGSADLVQESQFNM